MVINVMKHVELPLRVKHKPIFIERDVYVKATLVLDFLCEANERFLDLEVTLMVTM